LDGFWFRWGSYCILITFNFNALFILTLAAPKPVRTELELIALIGADFSLEVGQVISGTPDIIKDASNALKSSIATSKGGMSSPMGGST
jgi:hypothetical protein